MAEEIDRGSSDRQATWVALRTLRQRPTLVGRTEDGTPVYEIRTVRLVLAPGASHFRRLARCARCERDVPGPPVLTPADLNRPASLVFCDRCARSAGSASPGVPWERQEPPAPAPQAAASPVVTDANAGERQRLSEQVADLLRAQNAELATLSASIAGVRAEMRELGQSNQALTEAQRELDQRLVVLSADVTAKFPSATEPVQAVLPEDLDHLRSEIASLRQRMDDEAVAQSAAAELADSSRALAQRQAEIETTLARELADVRASLAAMVDATAPPLHAALAEGLHELRSEIASFRQRMDDEAAARSELGALVESNRQDLGELEGQLAALPKVADERADVAEVELLRAEIVSGEQRSRDEFTAVAALLEALRKELTEAMHEVAHETLMAMAEPLRDLTKAREDFERRLESLQQKAQEDQRRVEALNASATAGASRLHALEQKLHASVQRLIHPVGSSSAERQPPRALLDSLERQLREAEERLGQL